MELVIAKSGSVFCDSKMVAKKFNMKHAYVVRTIIQVADDISDIRVIGYHPDFFPEKREYQGQDYTAYLMNRDFFSALVMRFRGKGALKWQLTFIAAFNAMEQRLLLGTTNKTDQQWIGQREQSKLARKEETDVIKEFVEYATEQGSKSAKFYYKHITNAAYKALDLMAAKKPKLRDTLDLYQLAELTLIEREARAKLKLYMDLGRHYKDIYSSVKDDLLRYGSGLRLETKKPDSKEPGHGSELKGVRS